MNTIDIIILIILLYGGISGLRQGFVMTFANLVGWIFALIVASKFAYIVAPSMSGLSGDPVVQKIAAFAFIVLVVMILCWVVSYLLNGILKTFKLGPLNRLAGGAFGALKGLLIVLITMQGLQPWVESSPHWKQSKFIQSLLPFAPLATELSKDAANEALHQMRSEEHNQDVKPLDDSRADQANADDRNGHSKPNPFN